MSLKVEQQTQFDKYDFMMWRPVMLGKATYYEVAYQWVLDDLLDCLEMLDIQDALEKEARDKVK